MKEVNYPHEAIIRTENGCTVYLNKSKLTPEHINDLRAACSVHNLERTECKTQIIITF